jgi:N-acetylglucosaminyldiphosphoundecaprenol N-acetyl-beta-D-mannosaminyltransferase
MHRVDFLGHPVDNPTMEEALATMEEFISAGVPRYIVAINASKLWRMEHDPLLEAVVRGASLLIPEKAIVTGSSILGLPIRHHVGGSMLLEAFLPVAERNDYRIYFLGARPAVIERLINKVRQDYPRLQIAGWHHGYLSADDDRRVTEEIQKLHPDALFIAMGTPKQEFWIAEHIQTLCVPVCMGVGGSFDVLSGFKKDAPEWVRAIAMEWLYRLLQDPKNLWKRYLTAIPWFLHKVVRARLQDSLSRG